MRRAVALGLLALALAGPAAAQGRPSSLALTCEGARRLVLARGAVLLGTGGQTFDRYVSDRRFCEATEALRRSFVPTRDTSACFVGYRCYEPGRSDSFGFDD